LLYYILKGLLIFFSKLSIERVQATGRLVGRFLWLILRNRRKVAIINARIIGSPDPVKTAKLSFEHTFCSYLESSYTHNINEEFIDKYVVCSGKRYYDELVEKGERFAILTAHIGSWELAAQVIPTLYGFNALVAGRAAKNRSVEKAIAYMRNAGNVVYISRERYIEKIAEYEKKGYRSASLLDHGGTHGDSVLAEFFGYRVFTLAGLCAMCVRRKIPMLPCYLIRTASGFKAVSHPPVYPGEWGDRKARIAEMAARVNHEYEKIIWEYPEQWYLLHRRFKRVAREDGSISTQMYKKN
jgi:KDO2-lipid IV(A) lauroyltransferase